MYRQLCAINSPDKKSFIALVTSVWKTRNKSCKKLFLANHPSTFIARANSNKKKRESAGVSFPRRRKVRAIFATNGANGKVRAGEVRARTHFKTKMVLSLTARSLALSHKQGVENCGEIVGAVKRRA